MARRTPEMGSSEIWIKWRDLRNMFVHGHAPLDERLRRDLFELQRAAGCRRSCRGRGRSGRGLPRPRFSTAITTTVFFSAPRPCLPGATPPT